MQGQIGETHHLGLFFALMPQVGLMLNAQSQCRMTKGNH